MVKSHNNQMILRGGGVGFLVHECLVGCGEREGSIVYWWEPADSNSVSVLCSVYEQLQENVLGFTQKGRVMLGLVC